MLFTPEVIEDILKILTEHFGGVAAAVYGKDAVSPEQWQLAKDLGLVTDDMDPLGMMGGLHTFGAFLAHLDQAKVTDRYGMSLETFEATVRRDPVPQTDLEHRSARYMAQKGAQYITGLGDRKARDVATAMSEEEAAFDSRMRGIMRDVMSAQFGDHEAAARMKKLGIERGLGDDFFANEFRSSIGRMVSDMGHATGDWARDLKRIVQTEGHHAVQQGMSESWTEQEEKAAADQKRPPRRVLAYKQRRPDACKHCIRLHEDGGLPRVFYLDDLMGNGTNVGRRAADWQAVVGSTHPWCACTLHKLPGSIRMPTGWVSGAAAPGVVGPGGRIV